MARTEAYHIHIDGPIIPSALLDRAINELGFLADDFPHEMQLVGNPALLPARQLTRVFKSREDRDEVHALFAILKDLCTEAGFKGFIQMEFIMSETELGEGPSSEPTPTVVPNFALRFKNRSERHEDEEGFKKHEIHLELKGETVDTRTVQELTASGFGVTDGENPTFTASGQPNDIRRIREEVLRYFSAMRARGEKVPEGRMITEATVDYALFGIPVMSTPPLVDCLSVV